jgi:hypothetical protein
MINIILCGKTNDTSISDALLPALGRYGGVQYFNGRILANFGGGTEFIVYDCEEIPEIELNCGILLFKNSFHSSETSSIPSGFSCVLETKNLNAAAMLKDTDTAAITCGTSPKDTISIAGLDEANAALSLQRSIITVTGEILEPHDFTVKLLSKLGPHRILAVCAALLISGVDSSQGYII